PFAAIVNVMLLCSPRLGSATANIVAVPVQVPANEAGIVAPAACAVTEAGVLACPAGEVLLRPAEELEAVPGGAVVGEGRGRNTRRGGSRAAAPPAARNGPRLDRFGRTSAEVSQPGPYSDAVEPASSGTESVRPSRSSGAIGPVWAVLEPGLKLATARVGSA